VITFKLYQNIADILKINNNFTKNVFYIYIKKKNIKKFLYIYFFIISYNFLYYLFLKYQLYVGIYTALENYKIIKENAILFLLFLSCALVTFTFIALSGEIAHFYYYIILYYIYIKIEYLNIYIFH
jgi:hypothetical protein